MNNKFLPYIVSTGVLLGLFIYASNLYFAHPTLNDASQAPAYHLKNVSHYLRSDEVQRSVFHLNKAIEKIENIKRDANPESYAGLENAIDELLDVNDQLCSDTVNLDEMYKAFEITLNHLACTELEISEMYAEDDRQDLATVALKYAQMHIRDALVFQQCIYDEDSEHMVLERDVFRELDSLIANESVSAAEMTVKIDGILKKVDYLIAME